MLWNVYAAADGFFTDDYGNTMYVGGSGSDMQAGPLPEESVEGKVNLIGIAMRSFGDWYIDIFTSFYVGGSGLGLLSKISKAVTEVLTGNLEARFGSLFAVMQTVGIALVLVYTLSDFLQRVSEGRFNALPFLQWSIKMVVAIGLVIKAKDITLAIINFGDAAAGAILQKAEVGDYVTPFFASGNNAKEFYEALEQCMEADYIAYIVKAMLIYLVVMADKICTVVIAVTRSIEICVRMVFAPIALANVAGSVSGGGAARYLKKTFAVVMQYAVLVVICAVAKAAMESSASSNLVLIGQGGGTADQLVSYLSGGITKASVTMFLHGLLGATLDLVSRCGIIAAKIGIMLKSQQICNDIFGVGG